MLGVIQFPKDTESASFALLSFWEGLPQFPVAQEVCHSWRNGLYNSNDLTLRI